MPIENYYYVSVCMRLGSCYIDSHANECKDPYWTIIDVNDKNKSNNASAANGRNNKLRIVKNGIIFVFQRGAASQ